MFYINHQIPALKGWKVIASGKAAEQPQPGVTVPINCFFVIRPRERRMMKKPNRSLLDAFYKAPRISNVNAEKTARGPADGVHARPINAIPSYSNQFHHPPGALTCGEHFWSAAIPPRRDRFPTGRHVCQFQSAVVPAHSK